MRERPKAPQIPHKDFAKRLSDVCDDNPMVPPLNYGRLMWIRDNLEKRFNVEVTRETVRKWLAGLIVPRNEKMKALANLLGVDDGWLAFGVAPEFNPAERSRRALTEDGAVNVVAGLIQLSGGFCATPEEKDMSAGIKLYAILRGRQRRLAITLAHHVEGETRFQVPTRHDGLAVVAVVPTAEIGCVDLFIIPHDLIRDHGKPVGSHINVTAKRKGKNLSVEGRSLPKIADFAADIANATELVSAA